MLILQCLWCRKVIFAVILIFLLDMQATLAYCCVMNYYLLRRLRKEVGLTQRKFAVRVGCCYMDVSKWECRRRQISDAKIERYYKIFYGDAWESAWREFMCTSAFEIHVGDSTFRANTCGCYSCDNETQLFEALEDYTKKQIIQALADAMFAGKCWDL